MTRDAVGAVRELVVGAWSWDPSSGPAFGATSRNVSEREPETLNPENPKPAATRARPSSPVTASTPAAKKSGVSTRASAELTTSTSVVVRTTFRDPDPAKDEPDAPKTIAKTP